MPFKYILFAVVSIGLLSTSCASKKYAKQAQKLDQAGLFNDAAQKYYQSVLSNPKNIEAKMGLQRTGQLLLQQKLSTFKTHYDNNATQEAVYAYLDAQRYFNQIQNVGVSLIMPAENSVYFNDVKTKYLSSRYNTAMQALDVEDFTASESVFAEILNIDASYKDAKANWTIAKYEPRYRKAIEYFDAGFYRTAYFEFNAILNATGQYKDAISRKADALSNATITIGVVPFVPSSILQLTLAKNLRNKTLLELSNLKSPFYKVVMDETLASLPSDGKRSQTSDIVKFLSVYAPNITAQTVLTGRIVNFSEKAQPLMTTERKGYIKRTEEVIDKTTGEKRTLTHYDKVKYTEHYQSNISQLVLEFVLIDVKTGTVLVADEITFTRDSKVNYASFNGDTKKLIPGYWKEENATSPEDVVYDNADKISVLHNLINANKTIKPVSTLTTELITDASQAIATAIENYNPEK